MLKCPYCDHRFKLTWKRYLTSIGPLHRCPDCGRRSMLSIEPAVVLRLFLIGLMAAAIGVVVTVWLFGFNRITTVIGGALFAAVIIIPIDKHHDEYYRELKKIRKEDKSEKGSDC